MRILYGINGTGNGHRSRARDLVPALSRYAQIDVVVSGLGYSLSMPFPVRNVFPGLSFRYRKGSIDLIGTARRSNPVRLFRDVASLDLLEYDLVISDFEPISAWAARRQDIPSLHVSHQASFLSARVPRAETRDPVSELFLRHFSPCDAAIGLHFRRYAPDIRPPIVRREVRVAKVTNGERVAVYLPAVSQGEVIRCLDGLNGDFTVFSRECREPVRVSPNVWLEPPSECGFAHAVASGGGVFGHAGFELPSEAMYLRKPILSVPIGGQYEQQCNAAALEELGVDVIWKWDATVRDRVAGFLADRPVIDLPEITLPDRLAREILRLPEPNLKPQMVPAPARIPA